MLVKALVLVDLSLPHLLLVCRLEEKNPSLLAFSVPNLFLNLELN